MKLSLDEELLRLTIAYNVDEGCRAAMIRDIKSVFEEAKQ